MPDLGSLSGCARCKLWRTSMLHEHRVLFPTDVLWKEDTMFALEGLIYTQNVVCLDYIGYTYRIRADRSNTVAKVDTDENRTMVNKMALLRARAEIHRKMLGATGKGCIEDYCGSIFLSAIEVCLLCSRSSKLQYGDFRRYCLAAEECLRNFDTPLLSMKAELCRRLLVAHRYKTMCAAVKIATSIPGFTKLAGL